MPLHLLYNKYSICSLFSHWFSCSPLVPAPREESAHYWICHILNCLSTKPNPKRMLTLRYTDFNNLVVLVLTGWWLQNFVLRSIYLKSRFPFFSRFVPFLPHSWQKVLEWTKKYIIFLSRVQYGYRKKSCMLRSNPLLQKLQAKTFINEKLMGKLSFCITKTKDFILR